MFIMPELLLLKIPRLSTTPELCNIEFSNESVIENIIDADEMELIFEVELI